MSLIFLSRNSFWISSSSDILSLIKFIKDNSVPIGNKSLEFQVISTRFGGDESLPGWYIGQLMMTAQTTFKPEEIKEK